MWKANLRINSSILEAIRQLNSRQHKPKQLSLSLTTCWMFSLQMLQLGRNNSQLVTLLQTFLQPVVSLWPLQLIKCRKTTKCLS
jgi:hypothetical protein